MIQSTPIKSQLITKLPLQYRATAKELYPKLELVGDVRTVGDCSIADYAAEKTVGYLPFVDNSKTFELVDTTETNCWTIKILREGGEYKGTSTKVRLVVTHYTK